MKPDETVITTVITIPTGPEEPAESVGVEAGSNDGTPGGRCGACNAPAMFYDPAPPLALCPECFLAHVVPKNAGDWGFLNA